MQDVNESLETFLNVYNYADIFIEGAFHAIEFQFLSLPRTYYPTQSIDGSYDNMGTMSVPSRTLCLTLGVVSGEIWFLDGKMRFFVSQVRLDFMGSVSPLEKESICSEFMRNVRTSGAVFATKEGTRTTRKKLGVGRIRGAESLAVTSKSRRLGERLKATMLKNFFAELEESNKL